MHQDDQQLLTHWTGVAERAHKLEWRLRSQAKTFAVLWLLWLLADIYGWRADAHWLLALGVLAYGITPWESAYYEWRWSDWERRVVEAKIAGRPEPLPPNMEAGIIRRSVRKLRRALRLGA